MPAKYQTVAGFATLVQHRGPTTLPGAGPDRSAGPVVACLHDAGMAGLSFAGLLDHLAADHTPLSFDMPGHGRSGGLDALASVGAMAEHALGVLLGYGLEPAVLVGEGLGAAVALELAIANPAQIAGLVLVGGAAASYNFDAEIESLAAITAGRARREFDRSGYAPETDRSVYQQAFAVWVKTDPRATLGDRRSQARWTLGHRAELVMAPTVIVVGQHEADDTADPARALAGVLPSAQVVTLPGAGRRGVLEQPAALAEIVADLARSTSS